MSDLFGNLAPKIDPVPEIAPKTAPENTAPKPARKAAPKVPINEDGYDASAIEVP